jgi:hypothetical protein
LENAVEEERIKSALEIAMERVSRLPELTPEEIAEQKEKEYRPIGEALCNKYMQDIIGTEILPSELNQYPGDSGKIVRKALIACLSRWIRLDDKQAAVKAMEGLLRMEGDGGDLREKVNSLWLRMLDDYERRRDSLLKELESDAKKRLADLGIRGSAVLPNLNGEEASDRGLADLHRSFEPELEELRSLLTQRLQT